ncbi:MAG: matrixin family metalloprotease [Gemmatimonadales bacterium]
MSRFLLVAVLLCAVLLVRSRVGASKFPAVADSSQVESPAPVAAPPALPAPVVPEPEAVVVPPVPEDRTPIISRMARMEARRRLALSAQATYLDSLFTSPDSMVRRWSRVTGIRVAVASPDPAGRLTRIARSAIRQWTGARIGLSVQEVRDSTAADIVIVGIDRFVDSLDSTGDPDRTGLTELHSGVDGAIKHARITIAEQDAQGRPLDDVELTAVLAHEFGHAIGLPHSGHPADIMFPTVTATRISERDRSTATLLYLLPNGSLQEHR